MGGDVVIDVAFAVVFAFPALVRFHSLANVQHNWPVVIDDKVVSRNARIFYLPAPKLRIQRGQAKRINAFGDFGGGGGAAKEAPLFGNGVDNDLLLEAVYPLLPRLEGGGAHG